jgi:hypothetical protein
MSESHYQLDCRHKGDHSYQQADIGQLEAAHKNTANLEDD